MKVFALYGVAERGDLVLMFFPTKRDARYFVKCLPGRYRLMKVKGVGYDDIKCAPTQLKEA